MKNTLHTPRDKYLLNKLRLFSARRIEIIIKAPYINNKSNVPMKPNSSPNIVNKKSVCISGRKFRWL